MDLPRLDFKTLRREIIGVDQSLETPFGERLLVYADYTASGRCLGFVERYLNRLEALYANSHTEDDASGRAATALLHQAEQQIKDAVNAGPAGRIIATGAGATGAIDKVQQLVGVRLPGATRALLDGLLGEYLRDSYTDTKKWRRFLENHQPVVFVGPYEHHSNEISWREGLATVVEVRQKEDGGIDIEHLQALLRDSAYQDRLRIGSFSAASNVTGIKTDVPRIARLLHGHGALAFFDYAASAPYVPIDMNPAEDPEAALDAIFISPHKFLGGPGSSGVLVFNQRLYHRELPPSLAGGGTVEYVGPLDHDFIEDIETREKAGTPGILQTLRAALAFQVKEAAGIENIEAREAALTRRAMARWADNPRIENLGNPDPERRIGIISFNLRDAEGLYLHPRFVTVLLNDLFGIQSRAGCSCAGPYGHRLLGIDETHARHYRDWVHRGYQGIKPGWCRIGFHYVFDDAEADYLIDAVEFTAAHGDKFLPLYHFDTHSGIWIHKQDSTRPPTLSLADAFSNNNPAAAPLPETERHQRYRDYAAAAVEWLKQLPPKGAENSATLDPGLEEVQFFRLA
ncbi:MAG: aminotransferase class V-fold PLP-dependent enzyme [Pseudomonadota bacterium]|nr:aminotransferase class V-fold PLP-dependent enzyme [Pseudomonadota bacterium]